MKLLLAQACVLALVLLQQLTCCTGSEGSPETINRALAEEEKEKEEEEKEEEPHHATGKEETAKGEVEAEGKKDGEGGSEGEGEVEGEGKGEGEGEAQGEGEGEGEEGEGGEGEGEGEGEEGEEEEEEEPTSVDVDAACILLGGVTFVVFLFKLVNTLDDDVRRYAWKVISNTISIFMAVLFFQGNNQMLESYARTRGWHENVMVFVHYTHCSIYIIVMLAAVGLNTGVWTDNLDLGVKQWVWADAMFNNFEKAVEKDVEVRAVTDKNFDATRSTAYSKQHKMDLTVEYKRLDYDMRFRKNKAWSTLLAHMGGFAAIAAGGSMQQRAPFRNNPWLCFVPVIVTTLVLQALFQLTNIMRLRLKAEAKRTGRPGLRSRMVHEIVSEAENDIFALAASFNTVQVIRFAIFGELPNKEGTQAWENPPTILTVGSLFGCGVGFMVLSGLLAVWNANMPAGTSHKGAEEGHANKGHTIERSGAEASHEEESDSALDRFMETLVNICAMSSAWCTLFGARAVWLMLPISISALSPDGRILLAVILSVSSFLIVYVLDKIDDRMRGNSKASELVIFSIISGISVLVGFSWESSFDEAVASIASMNEGHQELSKFGLGVLVCFGLGEPWTRFILKRALQLEELKSARDSAEKAAVEKTKGVGVEETQPLLKEATDGGSPRGNHASCLSCF
mmetsp:Transcript_50890/g.110138  ORF Transcript_50890/g.110138 Transcript_50890/m.110138 type:complete len:681 (+) Transcript_50890:196-2238(+)